MHFLLSDDEEVISMFSEQAARDWENFLRCRAKEIISGMIFILTTNVSFGLSFFAFSQFYNSIKMCNI